jgi:hypothetical protein
MTPALVQAAWWVILKQSHARTHVAKGSPMRKTLLVALSAVLLLSACGTPLQQCLWRAEADLRSLETERAERHRSLDRGYALERQLSPFVGPAFCPHPVTAAPVPCASFGDRWDTVPVPINRRLETQRVAVLDRMIAEERARVAPAQSACRAQFQQG